jgi:hypothetical protein
MDWELEALRNQVDCRTVLEQAGWKLDKTQSTAHAAKYRAGTAQIAIVTHQGRGWFDPLADARGDVIALAQHLWGGSLGHARKALRPLIGRCPQLLRGAHESKPPVPLDAASQWARGQRLTRGTAGWTYLTTQRGLPGLALDYALQADVLREGIYGTVWALHCTHDGHPCGWEMRGPHYKGFSKGGRKALFRIGDLSTARRIAVTESAIDALSLAALERWPPSTAYVSTGGGFGSKTAEALRALTPAASRLVGATDHDCGGELLAERLRELALECGASFSRLRPQAKDWNAQMTGQGLHGASHKLFPFSCPHLEAANPKGVGD